MIKVEAVRNVFRDFRNSRSKEYQVSALNSRRFITFPFSDVCPAQLSSNRQISSIPISNDAKLPPHQADPSQNWMYPSEKQFYQAMERKVRNLGRFESQIDLQGWDPSAEDMPNVVKIHNAVNERVWREISHWESSLHPSCSCPKLKTFQGRPRDFSPKARLLNFLVGSFEIEF